MQHPDVFAPARLGPVRLRNRVVKAATFEGMTPDALVTDALVDQVRSATGSDLTRIARQYVDGARIAVRAGFDALDLPLVTGRGLVVRA